MLNEEHLDQLFVWTAALADFRKDVLLFERVLVVFLPELAEELGRIGERTRINPSCVGPQAFRKLGIDDQGTAQDAVLSHQVFGCRDLLLVIVVSSPVLAGRRGRAGTTERVGRHENTSDADENAGGYGCGGRDRAPPVQFVYFQCHDANSCSENTWSRGEGASKGNSGQAGAPAVSAAKRSRSCARSPGTP
jgi:hypothetical protein